MIDLKSRIQSLEDGITGIYYLMDDGVVIYVGQSTNIRSRLSIHFNNRIFDDFVSIPCAALDLPSMEAMHIILHKPKLNRELPITGSYITKRNALSHIRTSIGKSLSLFVESADVIFECGGGGGNSYIDTKYINEMEKSMEKLIAELIMKAHRKECK